MRYDWTMKIGDQIKVFYAKTEQIMRDTCKEFSQASPGIRIDLFRHELKYSYLYPRLEVVETKHG